jgi:hypothetical protein
MKTKPLRYQNIQNRGLSAITDLIEVSGSPDDCDPVIAPQRLEKELEIENGAPRGRRSWRLLHNHCK